MFLPAENQPGLIDDLEGDPFVGHALSSATCELYHRYGMLFLASLTAGLTTIKHRQFGRRCPAVINGIKDDGSQTDGGEPREVSAGERAQSPVERVTEKKV